MGCSRMPYFKVNLYYKNALYVKAKNHEDAVEICENESEIEADLIGNECRQIPKEYYDKVTG